MTSVERDGALLLPDGTKWLLCQRARSDGHSMPFGNIIVAEFVIPCGIAGDPIPWECVHPTTRAGRSANAC